MKYRSDIDGLRAVAVTLVILFHAGCSTIASGFIGVDVFFVISGYLITRIVLENFESGKFSISDFYNRRIWRLQPSLLVIVLLSLIISGIFYLSDDFNTFLHSVKNLLFFTSNKYFSDVTTSYASEDANYLILLHTWSLSVEWQWYLCFPLIMHLALKYVGRNNTFLACCAATLLLTFMTIYLSLTSHTDRYYDFLSRCFELQIGSCLAFGRLKISKKGAHVASVVSLLGIIALAIKTDVIAGYPNGYTIIIVLASGALIISGEHKQTLMSHLLSNRVLTGIGKRSYSLYLWHWPGLATLHYLNMFSNTIALTTVLCASLLLACASYSLIEMPLRKTQTSLWITSGLLIVLPLLIATGIYEAGKKFEFYPWRFGSTFAHAVHMQNEYKQLAGNRPDCLTDDAEGKYSDEHCTFGSSHPTSKAFFIGDSNSNHYWMFLNVLARDAGLAVTARSTATCLTLPGLYQYDWWIHHNTVYSQCHINTNEYYRKIASEHFNYVIIGELWPMYVSDKIINHPSDARSPELAKTRLDIALRDAFNIITKSGAVPVVMKEIFTRPTGYESCMKEKIIHRESYQDGSCNVPNVAVPPRSWFDEEFTALKKDYPSLIVIDIKDVQCADNHCMTEVNGISVFRDVGHLNDYAAHVFGEQYLQLKGNPFREVHP